MRKAPPVHFLATLAGLSLIGPLTVNMFLPAMPAVKAAFGASDALVGLTYSVALAIMGIATLIYGSLSDRHGRRPMLLTGLSLFICGSALAGLATSMTGLMAGRAIQAIGAGCGVTLARAIARDAYAPEHLVKVIAYLTMAYALGPMLSTLFGGVLIDSLGWRAVLWSGAIAGVLITGACYVVLYETHEPQAEAPAHAGFFRGHLALFAHLRFTAFVLQTGASSGLYYALAAAASFLMKDYLGRSATEFGAYFMLCPIGFVAGNLIASRISHRFALENLVLAGSVITFAAVLVQAVTVLGGHLSPAILFVPGFFMTFGQGIALPNAQVGAMRVIPALAGTAAGIGVFFQLFLGGFFAQFYSMIADGTPVPMVIAVSSGAVVTLAAGIVPFAQKRRRARNASQEAGAHG